jgi:hypothetical protein
MRIIAACRRRDDGRARAVVRDVIRVRWHHRSPTFDHGIALIQPFDAGDRVRDAHLGDLSVDAVSGAP